MGEGLNMDNYNTTPNRIMYVNLTNYSNCRKGKKGDKKVKKQQESIVKIAAANAKVWETRLEISDNQKKEYR